MFDTSSQRTALVTTGSGGRRLAKTPTGSPRMQKQPSTLTLRQENLDMKALNDGQPPRSASEGSHQAPPLKPARKGSIREALRRLFARRPKTAGEQTTSSRGNPNFRHSHAASVSRHSQAANAAEHNESRSQSQLPGLMPTVSDRSRDETDSSMAVPQRTLSAPLRPLQSNAPPRPPRPPFAVEFPQSSRLKPLDLGNPFFKDPNNPKRRATLPSIIMDEATMAKLAPGTCRKSEEGGPEKINTENEGDELGDNGGLNVPQQALHRRSRSAGDLQRMLHTLQNTNDRHTEIEYWRQTSAASFLPPAPERVRSPATTATRTPTHPLASPLPRSPDEPVSQRSHVPVGSRSQGSLFDIHPANRFPLESMNTVNNRPYTSAHAGLTLETRVFELESSMKALENKYNRLAGQANHRTVIIDNSPRAPNSSPPDNILNNLLDASNRYEAADASISDDGGPHHARHSTHPTHGRTFAALYSMINEERVARRELDEQLRNMQETLAELQGQQSQHAINRRAPSMQPHRTLSTMSTPMLGRGPVLPPAPPRFTLPRDDSFRLSDSMADLAASSLSVARNLGSDDSTSVASGTYPSPAHQRRQDRHHMIMDGGMF